MELQSRQNDQPQKQESDDSCLIASSDNLSPTLSPNTSEKFDDNAELMLTIQKTVSDASLIIAQNEIDILSAELKCALKEIAGSKDKIEDLQKDLKIKESSLAKIELHYDLLTAEMTMEAKGVTMINTEVCQSSQGKAINIEVCQSSQGKTTSTTEEIDQDGHPTPPPIISKEETSLASFNGASSIRSLDLNFADFKDIPELAIAPTESTSPSSLSEDSLKSTEGSVKDNGTDQYHGDIYDYYPSYVDDDDDEDEEEEEEDESITKSMLGKNNLSSSSPSPIRSLVQHKAAHRPGLRYPFIKVDHAGLQQSGRISPLSDCSGGFRERLGDITIGYIETDYTFSADMAEI